MKFVLPLLFSALFNVNSYQISISELKQIKVKGGLDYCKNLSMKEVFNNISVDDVINCYNMFEMNQVRKQKYLENIRKVLPLYVFNDLVSQDSHQAKTGMKFSFENEINQFEAKPFGSEFEFYNNLTSLFLLPKDGHLTFKVHCFNHFNFYFPLMLHPVYTNNTIKIIAQVNPKFKTSWFKQRNIDPTTLNSIQIDKINDQPVLSFLLTMVQRNGVIKDSSTRFNYLMSHSTISNKELKLNYGEFSAPAEMPLYNQLKITYNNSKDSITLPYVGEGDLNFDSAHDYFDKYCFSSNLISSQSDNSSNDSNEVELNYNSIIDNELNSNMLYDNELNVNSMSIKGYLRENPPLNYIIVDSNIYYTTLILKQDNVAVLLLPTNEVNSVDQLNEFQSMIHKSFVKLANLKCTKLIIDVSYNTGGPICTSLSLLDYINNQENDNEDSSNELNHNAINKSNSNHNVQYTTRMKNTLLANLLAESASVQNKQNHRVWGSNNWVDINNKQYNNNSWLTPGYLTERSKNINVNLMEYVKNNKDKSLNVNQLIANSNSNYQVLSNYFMDKCPKSELNNQKFPFQLENLMILTNGICLSSCSTLLNGFIQFNNPKIKIIYTDGHNMNTNQVSPHNMEGGQLYIYDKLIEDIENLRLKFNTNYKSIIPEIFPLATQFTFTLREQYLVKSNNPKSLTIYNSTMPMEYLNYVPTDRVYTNEILPQLPYNLGYHWIKASKLF